MATNKGYVKVMFVYYNKLSEGFYGKNRKKESEEYYLISIEKGHIDSMFAYAYKLSKGFYGENRKKNQSNII
jgi:hypothetical protein